MVVPIISHQLEINFANAARLLKFDIACIIHKLVGQAALPVKPF